MCAIAGIIGNRASKTELLRMLRCMQRRGDPECFGEIGVAPGFGFGANRLAIVDPAGGRQPFFTEDGTVMCVQNGEIYNHRSLRVEFEASANFRSDCDTEILLYAWLRWRALVLKRVEGMYAAAFANTRTGEWMLVRDPLGIKPLYWSRSGASTYFASEIKALVAVCGGSCIYELPPGSVLCPAGASKIVGVPRLLPVEMDDRDAVALVRKELSRAVASHLPPPGRPVAALLSGGVDSSTVLYLMSQLHKGPIEAFTLAAGHGPSADLAAARKLCQRLRIPLTVVSPSIESLTEFYIKSAVAMTENFEPALVRNACSYHFLCRAVRDRGFKVCLSGEGADELFGGYDYFKQVPAVQADALIESSLRNIHRTYLLMADRASMYATVEVRVPYMDYGFVSAAASLGPSARLRGSVDKWVLRNLYPTELPAMNRLRAKVGMNAGAGYGPNDPGDGIYAGAVERHYRQSGTYREDLRIASEYADSYALNLSDQEEVFNFARYRQLGFCSLVGGNDRPQLNTVRLLTLPPLPAVAGAATGESLHA